MSCTRGNVSRGLGRRRTTLIVRGLLWADCALGFNPRDALQTELKRKCQRDFLRLSNLSCRRELTLKPVGWVEPFAKPIVLLRLSPFAKIRAFVGNVACPILGMHSELRPLFPEINKASAFNAGRTARRGLLESETTL